MSRCWRLLGLDLVMTGLLLCETGWSITGDTLHEVIGITLTLCIVAHLFQHRQWFASLLIPRAWRKQLPNHLCNAGLVILMVVTLVSGLGGSLLLYQWFGVEWIALPRTLHTQTAYWMFCLVGIHLGLHQPLLARAVRDLIAPWPMAAIGLQMGRLLLYAAIPAGGYALFRLEIWQKLAGITSFSLIPIGFEVVTHVVLHLALLLMLLQLTHWLHKAVRAMPHQ